MTSSCRIARPARGLAVRYSHDGYHLLRQVHGPDAPSSLAGLLAVQALRRIWIQQFCLDVSAGEKVIWRGDEQGLPPARSRLARRMTPTRGTPKNAARLDRVQGAPVRDLP